MSAFASRAWPPRLDRVASLLKSGLAWSVFWFLLLIIASFFALAFAALPNGWVFAAVPPALAISWLFCRRWPVIAFALIVALSGGFWTIEQFTPIQTGPACDLLLIGLWVAGIQALIAEDDPGAKRLWSGSVAAMLFCFGAFLFIFMADDAYAALYTWRLSFWYIAGALLLAYVPMREGALWLLTRIILVVIAVVAAYALFRWVVGPSPRETSYVDAASNYEKINGDLRLFGSMGAGHILSAWMAPMIVFCFGLGFGVRGPWRIVSLVVAGMCAAALVGTHVRAGEAAAAVGIGFVIALGLAAGSLGARRIAAVGLASLVALVGLAVIINTQSGKGTENSKRFEAILDPTTDESFIARTSKWQTALDDIKHKPFGEGLGTSGLSGKKFGRFTTVSSIEIDSSYLKIALEQGIAVMVLFAFTLVLLLLGMARQAIEGVDPLGSTIALASGGALLAFAIQLGFGSYIEGVAALGVWIVVGLGMRACSRREPAAAPA